MIVIDDVRATEEDFPCVVLTAGSFDGVHLGHQEILRRVVQTARHAEGTAAVMTIRPHPREFFAPEHAPNLLTCFSKQCELFEAAGVDVVFVLRFNAEVANMDGRTFLREIVSRRCHAKHLVVGHDFRFGKGAETDYMYLAEVGPRLGIKVDREPPLFIGGERVSSTIIRERLLEGNLEGAEQLLGRRYSIVGTVISGRGIGKTLGFPTANVRPAHTAIPAQGVYAAEVLVDGRRHIGAVNIGIAPTIRQEDITVETFLLDFEGELQGRDIEIVFHKRLRPEHKFPSREALMAAIARDVDAVRNYFIKT